MMKLKYNITFNELLDTIYAVVENDQEEGFHGVLRVSETSKRIIELLQEGKDEDAIVTAMLNEYDATEDIIRPEVHSVIQQLTDAGILESAL